jgi:hypothetical protein
LGPSIKVIQRVDNILFSGLAQEVIRAEEAFIARCAAVGAVLNPAAGLQTQFEFLGERYVCPDGGEEAGSRSLSGKTREKVERLASFLASAANSANLVTTCRRVACFIGVLLYSGETMNVPPSRFHSVLRFYAAMASVIGKGGAQWSSTVVVSGPIIASLHAWATAVSVAPPQPLVPPTKWLATVTTDASAVGWGAITTTSSGIRAWAFQWQAADHQKWNLSSSVAAEPLAILRALCLVLRPGDEGRCTVHTDHAGMVFAGNKRLGKACAYNFVLSELARLFPRVRVDFVHVPGEVNPADSLSRKGLDPWIPPVLEVTSIGSNPNWDSGYVGVTMATGVRRVGRCGGYGGS